MKNLSILAKTITVLSFASCSIFGIRSEYKEVDYKALADIGDIEIRNYSSRVVVEIDNAKNRNEAFFSLFDYISGENRIEKSIEMTAPVEMAEKTSEKISMTAPVELKENSESSTVMMRFFLPKSFTLENTPKPTNKNLTVKELPSQTFAVLRYYGSSSNEKFLEKKNELVSILENSKWKVIGPVSFMGYDPPFTIPFLKRNEAIVPVVEVN